MIFNRSMHQISQSSMHFTVGRVEMACEVSNSSPANWKIFHRSMANRACKQPAWKLSGLWVQVLVAAIYRTCTLSFKQIFPCLVAELIDFQACGGCKESGPRPGRLIEALCVTFFVISDLWVEILSQSLPENLKKRVCVSVVPHGKRFGLSICFGYSYSQAVS